MQHNNSRTEHNQLIMIPAIQASPSNLGPAIQAQFEVLTCIQQLVFHVVCATTPVLFDQLVVGEGSVRVLVTRLPVKLSASQLIASIRQRAISQQHMCGASGETSKLQPLLCNNDLLPTTTHAQVACGRRGIFTARRGCTVLLTLTGDPCTVFKLF